MELLGFEDWNAVILQAVHGIGDVTRHILCHVSAQLQLKIFFFFSGAVFNLPGFTGKSCT